MLMKITLALTILASGAALAQEDAPAVAAEDLQKYQSRMADVYLPQRLNSEQVVELTGRYFGREFTAVTRIDGTVDFFYIQRRNGVITYYQLLMTIAPKKEE